MKPGAVVFAGGGSGGHIFPALAIHEELRSMGCETRSVFICSKRPLDAKILERESVEFHPISAHPVSSRPKGLWRFIRGWGPSVRFGRKLIRSLRNECGEVHVVAMGGFVAAPIARSAIFERAPLLMVNMDAVPGKANRLMARRIDNLVSCVPVTGPCANLNWKVVPPIVRPSALSTQSPEECRRAFGLDPALKTLLITGGSQGAITLNQTVRRAVQDFRRAFDGWQLIHQCGKGEDAAARNTYSELGIPALVEPFIERMGSAWRAADLVLSRAGAGGVADAWAYGVPTLFMPNPYHKDQHQKHNAARLVDAEAAALVDDMIDEGANARLAGAALIEFMKDEDARMKMRRALAQLGPANGARIIAGMICS